MSWAARERHRVRVPLLVLGAAAWVLLLTGAVGMHGHGDMHPDTAGTMTAGVHADTAGNAAGNAAGLLGWVVMVVAMMVPLLTAPVGHVLVHSLPRWRVAGAVGFVLAYLAVWAGAGAVLLWVAGSGAVHLGPGYTVVGALVLAVVWQISPAGQRCLNRLHRHPGLAAFGARARGDVLRFGITHGLWCVGSCWALMLVTLVVPSYGIPVMAVVAAWLAGERLARPTRPGWRLRGPVKGVRIATVRLRGITAGSEPPTSRHTGNAPRATTR